MTPAPYLFPIWQYSYLELPMLVTDDQDVPINLTGYRAKMQARTPAGALVLDLSTENGGVALGGRGGSLTIVIKGEQTANPLLSGAVYDLVLIPPSGNGASVLTGRIQLNKGAVHD